LGPLNHDFERWYIQVFPVLDWHSNSGSIPLRIKAMYALGSAYDKSATGCNVSTYLGFVNAGMDEVHFDREVLLVPGSPTTRNVGLW